MPNSQCSLFCLAAADFHGEDSVAVGVDDSDSEVMSQTMKMKWCRNSGW